MTSTAALQAALAVERAVVYGYGLAGAQLAGHALTLVRDAIVLHSERRDAIEALLRQARVTPTAGPPGYRPPFPVTDPQAAAALAARLEDGSAGAAWDLAAASRADDDSRRMAVEWLADAAVRAATWRRLAGLPSLQALPGQPA